MTTRKNAPTMQSAGPLVRYSLDASQRRARELARQADEGLIDDNPPYQRGHRWSTYQQQMLVKSWLQGIPVPSILLNDRGAPDWRAANGQSPIDSGHGVWAVIDGKQRLAAARAWFSGTLPVPASPLTI